MFFRFLLKVLADNLCEMDLKIDLYEGSIVIKTGSGDSISSMIVSIP